jgi:L-fuculose-phosphate aldolase
MASLKGLLADAGRVLAHEGQGDYVAGHVSLRIPDQPDRFLMKPAGIGLEEMTDDNIITVDIDGKKVAGNAGRHNEVFIHSEVLRARPDVQAVVHTHAEYAVVFVCQTASPYRTTARSLRGPPVFSETTDIITPERARRLRARSANSAR